MTPHAYQEAILSYLRGAPLPQVTRQLFEAAAAEDEAEHRGAATALGLSPEEAEEFRRRYNRGRAAKRWAKRGLAVGGIFGVGYLLGRLRGEGGPGKKFMDGAADIADRQRQKGQPAGGQAPLTVRGELV